MTGALSGMGGQQGGGGNPFSAAPNPMGDFWGNSGDPSNPAVTAAQPAASAQTQQASAAPPPPAETPGQDQGSLLNSLNSILFGGSQQRATEPVKYQASAGQGLGGEASGTFPQQPLQPLPQAITSPGGVRADTSTGLPPEVTGGAAVPRNITPSATVSPQSAPVSGNTQAVSTPQTAAPAPAPAPAAAASAAPAASNYPDIAGSAREAGAGPPGQSYDNPAFSSPPGGGLPPVLQDLLSLNFGRFIADLLGQTGMPQEQNFAGQPAPSGRGPQAIGGEPQAGGGDDETRKAIEEAGAAADKQTPSPTNPLPGMPRGVSPQTSAQFPPSAPAQSPTQTASATPSPQQTASAAGAIGDPMGYAGGTGGQPTQMAAAPTTAPTAAPKATPGTATASLPPPTTGGIPPTRAADTGRAVEPAPVPGTAPAHNWWGTKPPDYFQQHGGQPGQNLTTIATPFGRVTANRRVADDLIGLTNDMKAAGVPGITKLGGYNDRGKRYGAGKSSHAYGAAFDINDAAGKMDPRLQGWIDQHPQQWQQMLRNHNFAQYMPRADPNHIEWVGPGTGLNTRTVRAPPTNPTQGSPQAAPNMTRGDRNRNPGNIKMGPDAQRYGATGVDDEGHAIFPNVEAGIRAQADLLTRNYNGKTIVEMGRSYAKDPRWAHGVMAAGGFRQNERLNLRDPATMRRLQEAIWKQEGTHPFSLEEEAAKTRAGGLPGVAGLVTGMMGDTAGGALRTIQRARNRPADRPRPGEPPPSKEPPVRQFNAPASRGRRPRWQDQPSEDEVSITGGVRG
jgi:hypothetical protein